MQSGTGGMWRGLEAAHAVTATGQPKAPYDLTQLVAVNETLCALVGKPREALVQHHVDSLLSAGSRIFYQTHLFPLAGDEPIPDAPYRPARFRFLPAKSALPRVEVSPPK